MNRSTAQNCKLYPNKTRPRSMDPRMKTYANKKITTFKKHEKCLSISVSKSCLIIFFIYHSIDTIVNVTLLNDERNVIKLFHISTYQ